MSRRPLDISGKRFGKLIAKKPTKMRSNKAVVWECECDCGNTVYVKVTDLTSANVRSCGCLRGENRIKREAPYVNNKTGKKGVIECVDKHNGGISYVARFRGEYLGTFGSPNEASMAYENARSKYLEFGMR